MPLSTSNITPASLLEILFRHKKKVFFIPLVILSLGASVIFFAPRTYRSQAKLFLQIGRESVGIDPSAQTGQQMISLQQQGRDTEVNSAVDLMTSREVISKLVDRIGIDYIKRGGPAGEGKSSPVSQAISNVLGTVIGAIKSIDPISEHEEAIIKVEKNLYADADRDSTLISLYYSADSPVGAQKILETLVEVFQEEHLRIHRNNGSFAFFQDREALLRSQLDGALERLHLAKNKMGIASIDARRNNLEAQLQAIHMASYTAETERSASAASLADMRQQISKMPERLISSRKQIPNEGADLLREQLYQLQVQQMELKSRYSDSHPMIVAISAQVEAAQEIVDEQSETREETVDDINPLHRQISLAMKQQESLVAGLDARLEMLAEQEISVRQDLEEVNANEVLLTQLERDKALLDKDYFQCAENLEQARIDEALEKGNVSSISLAQAATFAEKPVSPSKLLVGLGSIALAFSGTVVTLLGIEQLSDKLQSEAAVEEATGVPVLASIPENSSQGRVLSR